MCSETMQEGKEIITDSDSNEFRAVEKAIRRLIASSNDQCNRIRRKQAKVPSGKAASTNLPFDFSDIIDYNAINNPRIKEHHSVTIGDTKPSSIRIIQIDGLPEGFYIIAGALSISEQISLSKIALEEYSQAEHTNLTNLSKISEIESENVVLIKSESIESPCQAELNLCSDIVCSSDPRLSSSSIGSSAPPNIWKQSIEDNNNFQRFKDLRWSSLGYHYNWTKRMYQENLKSKFPLNLSILCKYLAGLVGENMDAEAAIVNFYPVGTYMSGHLDDAEHAMEEPIVSISLGCPAIFLLGGKTKNERPTAIIIRSGDVIIMSKESRSAYHGVPGVISHKFLERMNRKLRTVNLDTEIDCCCVCKLASTMKQNPDYILTTETECGAHLDGIIDSIAGTNSVNNVHEDLLLSSLHDQESWKAKVFSGLDSSAINENDPVFQYLQQGRININVRRVARPNTAWIDKCGSGASYLTK